MGQSSGVARSVTVLDFVAWGRGWMNEWKSRRIPDRSSAEGLAMRGGGEQVVLMVSGNYGTGCRRVT